MVACLTDQQVSGVVLGTLSVQEMDSVSLHLETCAQCETRLRAAEELSDGFIDTLRRGLRSPTMRESVDVAGLEPGSVLGDYVLGNELGRGGMGRVFRATHTRMKRDVALKVVSPRAVSSPEAVGRFQREIELVGRLSHTNIATAYDAREHEGTFYLILEFIDGSDLAKLVRKNGTLPIDQAVSHVLQAAKGLAYAHRRGVIHRDVKPANLMIDAEGTIKVLDLGLSRLRDEGADDDSLQAAPQSIPAAPQAAEVTQAGAVMGTLGFLAPEQAQDARNADHRADIYSLGCTLFYLLTGRAPRPAETGSRTPLRMADLSAPAAVEAAVAKMLARRPEDRFASMADVIGALELHLRRQSQPPARPLAIGSAVAAMLALAVGVWYLGPWRGGASQRVAGPAPAATAPVSQASALLTVPFNRVRAEQLQQELAQKLSRPAAFTNSMGASFALIPPGQVSLDRDLTVTITQPYYIGKREVTVREFRQFADETGFLTDAEQGAGVVEDSSGKFTADKDFTWRTPGFAGQTEDCPVVQMSYADVTAYCEWLSSKEGIGYRLPTQAQWLWAARAGIGTSYLWGMTDAQGGSFGWTVENSERRTHPVGKLAPNHWDLFDVHGNAAEWVYDYFIQTPPPGVHIDWAGPEIGPAHILCGSGFHNPRVRGIDTYGASSPQSSHFAFGFRLAVSASEIRPRGGPATTTMNSRDNR